MASGGNLLLAGTGITSKAGPIWLCGASWPVSITRRPAPPPCR